jgi:PAS domain S-box-containing protein
VDKNVPKSKKPLSAEELSAQLEKTKQQADEFNNLNRALVASIGDGLIVVNEYGIIVQVNQPALDMLGYEKDDLVGEWLPRALPSRDKDGNELPTTERPVLKSLVTGHPETAVTIYIRRDGSTFPTLGTAAPFLLDGKPRGAIIIFRDFTHETMVEKAKDEFVSLASHQMRTPLTSILLYVGLIKYEEESLSPEIKKYLKRIETSARNMEQLVGDFLNISKLELGKLDIKPIPMDLVELIDNQISEVRGLDGEHRVKINFKKPARPAVAQTDPGLLAQAVHNILTNSIRYRSGQKPAIDINIASRGGQYVISFKDNGIGIPENAKDKIFQRLYRADNAVETQSQGTGLGLYLVKKITEALGGSITFESQENRGTTFFINLPKEVPKGER